MRNHNCTQTGCRLLRSFGLRRWRINEWLIRRLLSMRLLKRRPNRRWTLLNCRRALPLLRSRDLALKLRHRIRKTLYLPSLWIVIVQHLLSWRKHRLTLWKHRLSRNHRLRLTRILVELRRDHMLLRLNCLRVVVNRLMNRWLNKLLHGLMNRLRNRLPRRSRRHNRRRLLIRGFRPNFSDTWPKRIALLVAKNLPERIINRLELVRIWILVGIVRAIRRSLDLYPFLPSNILNFNSFISSWLD